MKPMLLFAMCATGLLLVGCEKSAVQGPGGKKLTLTKPADQTVTRGDTNQVKISLNRDNFRDAVQVKFENLPQGVIVQDGDPKINAEDNSATFTLKADPAAALVKDHEVKVTLLGPDGMTVAEVFKITVKDRG